MPDTSATRGGVEDPVVQAARAGDEAAFGELAQRHRRELHVHCYRMTGSFEEAEDLVQETFLRAWRRRDSFEGGPGFRAWLYRIATNACLDALRSSRRRVTSLHSFAEVPWLLPTPTGCWTSWRRATPSPTPWSWPARPSSWPISR
jgi:DNA-directed RNA polymerase specialized sigma24 family protein